MNVVTGDESWIHLFELHQKISNRLWITKSVRCFVKRIANVARSVNKQCLLDMTRKEITALWVLKSNVLRCIFASGWENKYRQIDRQTWIDINGG